MRTVRTPAFLLTAAALLCLAAGASGQEPARPSQAQDSRTVTVVGRRESPMKRAQKFVHQIIATNEGQVARFIDPVCPQSIGVAAASNAAIEDRLRRDALAAGARVAPAGCRPNLIVAMVSDADSFTRTMEKRHGDFFDAIPRTEIRDALRSGPTRSWRLIATLDQDAHNSADVSGAREVHSSELFVEPTQDVTLFAMVVIDKKVGLDKTVSQIADYAAMRALAGARPPSKGPAAVESIVMMFDPDLTPATEMTALDRDFLAGVYSAMEGNMSGLAQTNQIARRIAYGDQGGRRGRDRRGKRSDAAPSE